MGSSKQGCCGVSSSYHPNSDPSRISAWRAILLAHPSSTERKGRKASADAPNRKSVKYPGPGAEGLSEGRAKVQKGPGVCDSASAETACFVLCPASLSSCYRDRPGTEHMQHVPLETHGSEGWHHAGAGPRHPVSPPGGLGKATPSAILQLRPDHHCASILLLFLGEGEAPPGVPRLLDTPPYAVCISLLPSKDFSQL